MSTEHLLDDIREVNLSYLMLIQRLIVSDRELAMFRLKIDEDMADLLSTVPVGDLAKLAQCNQLLCHFSLDSADELYALINAPKDEQMRQAHAAILLAGQDKREGDRRKGERRLRERRQADSRHYTGPERRKGGDRRQRDRRVGPRRHGDREPRGTGTTDAPGEGAE